MGYELVGLELDRDEHIATITLRRPETLNALSRDLVIELRAALGEVAEAYPEIRVLILTGEGRGFSSGADMRSMVASAEAAPAAAGERNWDDPGNVVTLAATVQQLPQPVIAAVNGVAVGGGLGLACSCDILIASEEARFGALFVKRSLVPDTGASASLARLVSHSVLSEMCFTGRIYDAQWALRRGIVNDVVPADRLLEVAREMAREIAGNPPLVVRSIKRLLQEPVDLAQVVRHEADVNAGFNTTEDRREALRAYAEKRQPVFHGR